MKRIVIASNNKHKIKEISQILCNYELLTLEEIGYSQDIDETGTTFLENALIKAKTINRFLKEKGITADVLSDDSGLCVNSLHGAPGIYSARYGKENNSKSNRDRLLSELESYEDRRAYFTCTMVLYHPNDTYESSVGNTEGIILKQERGNTDFGYDCIFFSLELNKSFGEATDKEKNAVSHRGKALTALLKSIHEKKDQ